MRWAAFAAVLVAGILPRASGAQDLDPSRKITQYRLRAWSDENGLPQNSVLSVLQLRDGTVLAGTEDGLAIFDGSRFGAPVWGPLAKVGPVRITRLVEGSDGTIWIGTRGAGLLRVGMQGVTTFGPAEGLPGQAIESIHIDAGGVLWVGTTDAGLFRLEGGRPVAIPLGDTPRSEFVQAISSDASGRLLVGTRGGLFTGRPGRWRRYGRADGLPSDHVYALTPAPHDTVWIGTASGGLAVLTGNAVRPVPNAAGFGDAVLAIRRGGNGVVWLGTNGGGLHRLHAGKLQSLTTANGLPSNLVWSLASDDEDGLWIGTNGGGLIRLDDPPVSVFGSAEGLSSDIALATLESRDGTLWVGTAGGGLNAIKRGVVRHFTTRDGLATNIVTALHEDPSGAMWVGTSSSGLHMLRDGRIERIDMSAAFPGAGVNSIRVDAQGRLWVGSNGAGLAIREGSRWRYLRAPESLPSNFVYAMAIGPGGRMYVATGAGLVAFDGVRAIPQPAFADRLKNDLLAIHASPSGSIWLSSQAHGIARLRAGRMVHIGADRGLPGKAVNGILEDTRGTMWITTNSGILAVPRAELEEAADGKRMRVSGYSIGTAEGMRSRETNGGVDPPGWAGRDGSVWIPTLGGVVTVDGDRLATVPRPRVSVTGLVVLDSLISA